MNHNKMLKDRQTKRELLEVDSVLDQKIQLNNNKYNKFNSSHYKTILQKTERVITI